MSLSTSKVDNHYRCQTSLDALKNDINHVHKEITHLIETDERLIELMKIITSVPGVGPVIAIDLLIITNEFKNFNTANKLATYCGTAPFAYSSSISLNKKPRVSKMANRRIKSLLYLASMTEVRAKSDYKNYFNRKVAEGKPKMSVLNAVQNKLLHRVFACVMAGKLF